MSLLRIPKDKAEKYRETPVPSELEAMIQTVNSVHAESYDALLVDASTRTIRRWVERYADEVAEAYTDEKGGATSQHTSFDECGRRCSPVRRALIPS